MQRLTNWLKNLRPLKIISIFLAGTFLLLNQACSRPNIAEQPPQPAQQPPNAERYDPTQDYPSSEYQGGMNKFSDVDPRSKDAEKSADAKANKLIKGSQKNIQESAIDSSEQLAVNYQQGKPLDERMKNLGEDVGNSAEEFTEGIAEGTKKGAKNLQENVTGAVKDLKKKVERSSEDIGKNIKRQVEDAGDTVDETVEKFE
jgi:ElaB/YqjD/DUF883 family membrane-anchored ribosome-binding protein